MMLLKHQTDWHCCPCALWTPDYMQNCSRCRWNTILSDIAVTVCWTPDYIRHCWRCSCNTKLSDNAVHVCWTPDYIQKTADDVLETPDWLTLLSLCTLDTGLYTALMTTFLKHQTVWHCCPCVLDTGLYTENWWQCSWNTRLTNTAVVPGVSHVKNVTDWWKYDWLATWSRLEKAKWLTDDLSQYDWRRRRYDDFGQHWHHLQRTPDLLELTGWEGERGRMRAERKRN